MTRDEFIRWAKSRGWTEDKWGHLRKTKEDREYRFKLSRIAARYEVKTKGYGGWVRISSGYFKDLTTTPDGKLSGLTR